MDGWMHGLMYGWKLLPILQDISLHFLFFFIDPPNLSVVFSYLTAVSEVFQATSVTLPADSEALPAASQARPAASQALPAAFEAFPSPPRPSNIGPVLQL